MISTGPHQNPEGRIILANVPCELSDSSHEATSFPLDFAGNQVSRLVLVEVVRTDEAVPGNIVEIRLAKNILHPYSVQPLKGLPAEASFPVIIDYESFV